MDDSNSPQDHKVLVVGDTHFGSINSGVCGENLVLMGTGGNGKSKLAESLVEENFLASRTVQNGKRKKKKN